MSDLIDRQALKESIEKLYQCDWKVIRDTMFIAQVIDELPSAEPEERTAKVNNQIFNNSSPYTVGAWIGTCECGELVSYSSKYCHMCGARLEWNHE